ncbi:MAG TPA: DMT family transporter [Candidatus Sulfotelmatobacter sp.]|nr:DMT family transporter [Candidatus Sulfotelmatobacter sp.]
MSTAAVATTKSRTAWFFLLLALASLMWSGQGTAVKILDRHMGPIAITFVPFYITTVLLVPLLLKMRKENPGSPSLTLGDWIQFSIAGIGGQVLAQLGMTWGVSKSLASNGAILNLLIPVISAVLASIMLHERITLLRVAALTIGLVGVVLMSVSDWKQASFGEMRFLVGNLLILCGCLGSSFYNVYCKGLMKRFAEIEILIFSYVTASVASIPLLIWAEPFSLRTFRQFDWQSWAAFAFLALFMYGASMLLFFRALQHLDVTTASASLYLVPVFGVLLAAVLLGERLSMLAMVGSAVVLTATVLIMKYDTSY